MTQIVDVGGGVTVEFPDGMSQADILAALKSNQSTIDAATVKPYEDAEAAKPARMAVGLTGQVRLVDDVVPPAPEEKPKGLALPAREEAAANEQAKRVGDVASGRVGGTAAELQEEVGRAKARATAMSDPVRNISATVEGLPQGALKVAGGLLQATAEGVGGRPLEGLMPEQLAGPDGLADRTSSDALADIGASLYTAADAEEKRLKSGLKPGLATEAVQTAIESAAFMLPAMATGGTAALGAGAGTAAARAAGARMLFGTMGASTFGQSYGEARAQGLAPGEAGAYAAVQAAIEVGTEFAPIRELFKHEPSIAKKFANFMAKEVPQELLATTLQAAVDKVTVNPNMTGDDFLKQLALTVLSTPLAGGAQVGVARAAQGLIGQPAEKPAAERIAEELQRNVDATDYRPGSAELAAVSLLNPDNAQLREVAAPILESQSVDEAIANAQAVVAGTTPPSTPAAASATLEAPAAPAVADEQLFTDEAPNDVTQADNQPVAPAEPVRSEPAGAADDQAWINRYVDRVRGGAVVDGVAHLESVPVRAVDPGTFDADTGAVEGRRRLSSEQARAVSDFVGAAGTRVVFYADDPSLPDGFVTPDSRRGGVIFVSDNPLRAGAFVAAHELTHVLEADKALTAAVDRAIARGVTPAGWAYVEKAHGSAAPAEPTARRKHLLSELRADLGGWALNDPTFLPKVHDELRRTRGVGVAKKFLEDIIARLTSAVQRIQKLFRKDPDLSAMVVSNLEEVRGALAKLYAAQYKRQAIEEAVLAEDGGEVLRSAKPAEWRVIDGASGDIRTREAAENIVRHRKEGTRTLRPNSMWEGYDLRVREDELNPGAFLIEARRRPDIQASRKPSGEHGRRVGRDVRAATVTGAEGEKIRAFGFRVTGDVVMGAPSFIHTLAGIKKQIDRAVTDALSDRSHPEDAVWYREAGRAIREYAHGDEALMEKLTRLVAKLSQGAGVNSNVTWVIKAAYAMAKGEVPAVGRFPNVFRKDFAPLMDAPSFDVSLKGVDRKLQNFYRNLHDEVFQKNEWPDAVVVDRHAIGYIWNNRDKSTVDSDAQYDYAERVIQRATAEYNKREGTSLKPRDMQALLWGWWKRTDAAAEARAAGREFKAEGTAWNYPEFFARATANVTAELLPSVKVSVLDAKLSPAEKLEFSREALAVVQDANGMNELALRAGLVLYTEQEGSGGYEDKINPNVILGALARKLAMTGTNDPYHRYEYAAVDRYALGWQYIFKQDGVPWFRADPTLDPADLDRARERRAKAREAGKPVNEAAEPPAMSLGFQLTLARDISAAEEAAIFAALKRELGAGVGYTRVAPDLIVVVNYRGEDHVPFLMPDAEFRAGVERLPNLELVKDVLPFAAESRYHYHDYSQDQAGDAILQNEALGSEGADLLDWLRGRRAAFEAVVRRWEARVEGRPEARQEVTRSAKPAQNGEAQDEARGREARDGARPQDAEVRAGDGREIDARADRSEVLARVPEGFSRQVGPDTPVAAFRRGAHPVAVVGVHYGNVEGLAALDGTKFGTGARSEEAARLAGESLLRNRVYFYAQEQDGRVPRSEPTVTAPYVYRALVDNLYDFETDPEGIIPEYRRQRALAGTTVDPSNILEALVYEAGYDGYLNRQAGALVVMGRDSVPAEFLGDRGEAWQRFAVTRSAKPQTIVVDGVERSRLNSKGKPIAATDEALRNFWRWFGESKVVDAEGRPLVVYHGTLASFKRFETRKNTTEGAAFFTPDAETASGFAIPGDFEQDADSFGEYLLRYEDLGEYAGAKPNVMPVYIRAKNPKTVSFEEVSDRGSHSFDAMRLAIHNARAQGFDAMLLKNVPEGFSDREGDYPDQWAVFSPRQIKSATGNDGTFDPANADITRSAKPIWYSALARAVEGAQMQAAPASGWRDWLRGQVAKGNVKADELEWSGVNDWLATQAGKVTRAAVQEFLDANGVRVEEVVLGAPAKKGARTFGEVISGAKSRLRELGWKASSLEGGADEWYLTNRATREELEARDVLNGTAETDPEVASLVRQIYEARDAEIAGVQSPTATKYGQYQLPGGKNYRELLLTLPAKNEAAASPDMNGLTPQQRISYNELLAQRDRELDERGEISAETRDGLRRMRDIASAVRGEVFRSPHFDQPNILAHVRFNERTDADGKRVLFVEEIQSDWAQKGKKQGFADPAKRADVERRVRALGITKPMDEVKIRDLEAAGADGDLVGDFDDAWLRPFSAVPRAPFVGKTEAWVALALKRMIRYAVDNGFDRVAWTTGEQQADRYDLSKRVDEITYAKDAVKRGTWDVGAHRGSTTVWSDGAATEKVLEDTLGKDIARRIVEGGARGTLKGLDLKFGGEGMRAFYDKIVPKIANRVLEKVGGGRVDRSAIGEQSSYSEETVFENEVPGFDITDAMREKAEKGMPQFSRKFDFRVGDDIVHKQTGETGTVDVVRPRPYTFDDVEYTNSRGEKRFARDTELRHAGVVQRSAKFVDVTQTEAFKRWFGDSKVVDADGRPLVVYHGSPEGFGGPGLRARTPRAAPERPFWVSPDRRYAESYTRGGTTTALYARITNPADLQALAEELLPIYNADEDLLWRNPDAAWTEDDGDIREAAFLLVNSPDVIAELIRRGYDGVTLLEGANDTVRTYGVFDPSQVKAVDNAKPTSSADITRSPKSAITGQNIQASWTATELTGFDAVVRRLQDKLVDTKRVVAAIRDAGHALTDNIDPYLQETLFHGRAAKRVSTFVEEELRPLLQDMQARGVEQQELEDFLWAAHAAERNKQIAKVNPSMPDGGSGLTNAQAADILAGLPVAVQGRTIQLDAAKMRAYLALQARVDAITNRTLDTLVAYGLESKETVDTWRRTYAHYVPLHRDLESDKNFLGAFGLGTGTGQGFSVRGSASRRAMGSSRDVVDVLANVAMQRERAIVRGEKNRIAQSVYGLATKAPNRDFWLPLNPDLRSITKANELYAQWQAAESDYNSRLAAGVSPNDPAMTSLELKWLGLRDDYNALIPKAKALQAKVEAELVSMGLNAADARSIAREPQERYIDPRTGLVAWRLNPRLTQQPEVLALRINGENRFVIFSNDERAKAMVTGLKNLDAEEMGWALQNAAKVTRWFASVNTQYNPVFGLVNGLRDSGALVLNLGTTPLKGQQTKVLKYAGQALSGIYSDLRAHRAGRQPTSVWAQRFEEMDLAGGKTGYRDMFANAAERADAIGRELRALSDGKKRWLKINESNPIFAWLSDYNTSIENAIRVAVFQAARDMGISDPQAAKLAKNITVNFNKKGTAATNTGALYAFFNASVQGTARMAETMLEHRGDPSKASNLRLSSLGKKIVLGGLVLGVMQALLGAAAGWDDDEPKQFQRERNFLVPVPGTDKYIAIPYPLGYHVIPNLARISTEFLLAKGKEPAKRLTQLASVIVGSFNPIGGGDIVDALTPTIVDPMIALARNKDWTGQRIAREDMNKYHPTPGWSRAKDTATPWARALAYAVNYATGGGTYGRGVASPTPDQIDYLIGQVTGGVGREISKLAQTVKAPATGEELPLYKVPVIGRFVGETTGAAATASKFYDNLEKIGSHADPINQMAKAHQSARIQEYFREHPEARLVQAANTAAEKMSELHREKQRLVKEGADKARVRAIEERAKLAMQQFNATVSRTVK